MIINPLNDNHSAIRHQTVELPNARPSECKDLSLPCDGSALRDDPNHPMIDHDNLIFRADLQARL